MLSIQKTALVCSLKIIIVLGFSTSNVTRRDITMPTNSHEDPRGQHNNGNKESLEIFADQFKYYWDTTGKEDGLKYLQSAIANGLVSPGGNWIFSIHGYQADYTVSPLGERKGDFVREILDQWPNTKIIHVDWAEYQKPYPFYMYFKLVKNMPSISNFFTTFISGIIKNNLASANDIHIVGFSLGAHLAGMTGFQLRKKGINLPRITGLDPAGLGFYGHSPATGLSTSSARYVEVLHTDSGIQGIVSTLGHVDIFVNKGRSPQPGCPSSLNKGSACSHSYAMKLYALSLKNVLHAKPCASATDFWLTGCRMGSGPMETFGIHRNPLKSGVFKTEHGPIN